MISNKGKDQLQSLYLKQFFGHFFERKQMLQTISTFQNGLKVLEIILDNFQHSHQIKNTHKSTNHSLGSSSFTSDIQKQGHNMNQMLENIYNRMQAIFEFIDSRPEKQSERSEYQFKETSIIHGDDDELYEMLNKYKNDFKREKEQRAKCQKEIKQLKATIDSLEESSRKINQEYRDSQFSLETIKKQNQLYEIQLNNLKQELLMTEKQSNQMRNKLEDYYEMQAEFNRMKTQFDLITLKYAESQQKQKLLTEKFKALDGIVQSKIEQNSAKWSQMISNKLESKDIYTNSSCKMFRNFVRSLNKQNISSVNQP